MFGITFNVGVSQEYRKIFLLKTESHSKTFGHGLIVNQRAEHVC